MQATRAEHRALCASNSRPSRRLAALKTAAIAATLVVSGLACQTKSLHPSHGLRYREMQAAQLGARGAHEPVTRGDEAVLPVQVYLGKLSGSDAAGGGGGGGMQAPSNSTAGVKPLVH